MLFHSESINTWSYSIASSTHDVYDNTQQAELLHLRKYSLHPLHLHTEHFHHSYQKKQDLKQTADHQISSAEQLL